MNWETKFKEYLGYSKEELVKIGKENGTRLIELMDKFYGDQDVSFAKFIKIYGTFAAIDWKINQEEYNLFRELTGVSASFNEFVDAVKESYNIDIMNSIDEFIDKNEQFKPLVINMGLAVSAFDGEISSEEKVLLEKYYS